MINRKDAQFVAINLFFLVVAGFFLIGLSRNGTIDFAVSRFFFDPVAGVFPLKEAPLFASFGHTGLKWLVLSIWLVCAVTAVLSRSWRPQLVFFCVAVASTTLTVALFKMNSTHSCPWDLTAFGGTAGWFPLFDYPVLPAGLGHCWPSGHAAGGFSLVAGYFAFRGRRRGIARIVLAAALSLGGLMSLVQIARGAHFLSHNLWSLWLAWLCSLVIFLFWRMLYVPPDPGNDGADANGFCRG